ncbi:O-antigen ligase family protein [Polaribacter batillariae]|uniref:O-antigen ligase family protein n=1 Tax=Polaribacter batillariae TaxID=2808900 RepID=A0ABX7SXW1_9FLAO|nr:O-antigen ligase family protein [Polaribacter batillariae]QTD38554.1 O-antigen ligase family protein [Polaribacter batillariae]
MSLTKASNIVLVLIVGLLLMVLPQINIANYVQSTITSKFIVFAYSCLVILVSFIAMFLFSKGKRIQISKLDIIFLLLFGCITINRYFIQPDYGFSIRYMELLGLGFLYIIMRNISYKTYVWLLLAIVISGIIQAIYGNLQLLNYYPSNHSRFQLTGSFFNPGPYSGFLVAVWPIALSMYLFKEKFVEQVQAQMTNHAKFVNTIVKYAFEYIPLLGVISIILVIPATHSRGAWLAVIVSSLLLLEFRYRFIKNTFYKATLTKKIVVIVFATSLFTTGLLGVYHFKKESADGRLFIWKVSSEIIKDYPFTGVGFDKFKAYYMNYQANYFVKHGETAEALVADNTYYAFNDWLQFVVENGLMGFLLLAIGIYMLFRIKAGDKNYYFFFIVKATFLAIGTFALFSYPVQILPIKLIMVVAFALLATIDKQKYTVFNTHKSTIPYIVWGLKTIVLALGWVGLSFGIGHVQTLDSGFKTWKNALNMYQYGAYEDAIEDFTSVYSIFNKEGEFLMNYGKTLSLAKQHKEAVQILEAAKHHLNTTIIETALGDAYKGIKQYKKAEIAYQHAANMIPVRFYPLYLQAKLYEESEQKNKAIAMAKTILKKEVKIPSTAIKEIKAEMKKITTEKPLGLKN